LAAGRELTSGRFDARCSQLISLSGSDIGGCRRRCRSTGRRPGRRKMNNRMMIVVLAAIVLAPLRRRRRAAWPEAGRGRTSGVRSESHLRTTCSLRRPRSTRPARQCHLRSEIKASMPRFAAACALRRYLHLELQPIPGSRRGAHVTMALDSGDGPGDRLLRFGLYHHSRIISCPITATASTSTPSSRTCRRGRRFTWSGPGRYRLRLIGYGFFRGVGSPYN